MLMDFSLLEVIFATADFPLSQLFLRHLNCINVLTKEAVKTGNYGDRGIIETVEEKNCDLVLLSQEQCCVIDDLICFEILWRL